MAIFHSFLLVYQRVPIFSHTCQTRPPHVRRLLHRLLRFQWIRREDVSAERQDTQALEVAEALW